jgi:hypothetical protein
VNASPTPEPVEGPRGLRPEITSVDVDPTALVHPGLPLSDRVVAALSFVSIFPVLIFFSRPTSRFVRMHLRISLIAFIIRTVWLAGLLTVWWWRSNEAAQSGGRLRPALVDIAGAVAVGAPLGDIWSTSALPWLLTPVLFGVLASACGVIIAGTGRSADFHAFFSADWTDPISRRTFLRQSPEEEKAQARRARERQIERLQKSSHMMRTEQVRRTKISDFEAQLERIELQREYHDQLLALGEISQRRYDQVNVDLDEQAAQLRSQLASLETRANSADSHIVDRSDGRLRRPSETLVESIAIVTPDGIPIFTYGQFQLDDAIVAGMLSAFDSLSEEVFGSRVSKTSLAEGQVLYFAHGDYVLIMAGFIDEPSPRQIEELRTMLKQFESANEGPISRKQYDPRYLHEVPIPFRFIERMQRNPAPLPDAS